MRKIGATWRGLSDDEKNQYESQKAEDKRRYDEEAEAFTRGSRACLPERL